MRQRGFGKSKKGEAAVLYTFENKNGMVMEVSDFGATLYSLMVPDKEGNLCDVVLGYDSAEDYQGLTGTFLGATVGRNANRIGNAKFTLNGKEYLLAKNNGKHNLHSGKDSYSFRIWKVKDIAENSITFALHSPDGDQGYPGALDIEVTYTLTDDNAVRIDYLGVSDKDTIINMTNHSYFNLDGHASGSVLEQQVWLEADAFTRIDSELIPTGEIVSVEGTPMDFRAKKTIGRDIDEQYEALLYGRGYDHNWVLNNQGEFQKVAELSSNLSGIMMEVYTDLPGVQIYTGNFIWREKGKQGAIYKKHQGICFETQYFPDAINHENFKSPVCKAGEAYRTATCYKFGLLR